MHVIDLVVNDASWHMASFFPNTFSILVKWLSLVTYQDFSKHLFTQTLSFPNNCLHPIHKFTNFSLECVIICKKRYISDSMILCGLRICLHVIDGKVFPLVFFFCHFWLCNCKIVPYTLIAYLQYMKEWMKTIKQILTGTVYSLS